MAYPPGIGYKLLPEIEHPDPMQWFDLILALGEGAMNRALRSTFDFLSSKDVRKHHRIQLPDHNFEATMTAPQVELDGATGETVWMKVNLDRIKFKEKVYKKWSFAYPIRLRSEDLNEAQVGTIQGISEEVRKILRLKAQDRTATVRNVMLDFERSSTDTFDAGRSSHEGATREALIGMGLHKVFSQYFSDLRKWENTYSLSFFVEDLKGGRQGQQPTFVPGKGIYSVRPPSGGDEAGSLNLLMMRQGQGKLPQERSLARNWAGSGQSDGRLIISWRLFLEDWLFPHLYESLKLPNRFRFLDHNGRERWGAQANRNDPTTEERGLDHFECEHQETSEVFIDTRTELGTDAIIKAIVEMEGYWYELIQVERKALGGGLWWNTCRQPMRGHIAIVAGSDGRLSFQADLSNPNADCQNHHDGVFSQVFDSLGGNKIRDRLESNMNAALSFLRTLAANAQVNLSKQLSESFLLPGGEQFFFKDARFDDDQNLVFDVTIKAQN